MSKPQLVELSGEHGKPAMYYKEVKNGKEMYWPEAWGEDYSKPRSLLLALMKQLEEHDELLYSGQYDGDGRPYDWWEFKLNGKRYGVSLQEAREED